MPQSIATAPIRLSINVGVPPERAFVSFTTEMGQWWPVGTHSICEDTRAQVIFEERAGGRVYERSPQGREESWAEVLIWEPPHRLVLAWRPNPTPGPKTELEISFIAEENGTRVELEHRGWERFGAEAEERRASYASAGGWPMVMERFTRSMK